MTQGWARRLTASVGDTVDVQGEQLNLRSHVISRDGIQTRAPIDLEGHKTKSGEFFLLDFSRMMPPEQSSSLDDRGAFLYRLLRPEFVQSFPKPLCPDALSTFLKWDPDKAKINKDIARATW